MSSLQVPGSLIVSLDTITGVGIPALENNLIYDVLMYDIVSVARTKVDGSATVQYFIESEFDINSKITYVASSTINGKDDAYGIEQIDIASVAAINANVFLPSASDKLVDAGELDAEDPNKFSLGKFPVILTIACDSQGFMTANINITGNDVAANVEDNPNLAQKAYWVGIQDIPLVTAISADSLNTKVSVAELTTLYTSELRTIQEQYNNQNMIQSWAISVNKIDPTTDNILSHHARFLEKSGDIAIFDEGHKMITSTPYPYSVSIIDYLGNATIIIPQTNVYGVLSQKTLI